MRLPTCNYYKDFCIRDICHSVKKNDIEAIKLIADWYIKTNILDEKSVIIPIPNHNGKAEYTLRICKIISEKTGCKINDILRCVPHISLYEQKKSHSKKLFSGIYKIEEEDKFQKVFLIDNVIASGKTMNDCLALIPKAEPFAYATVKEV